MNNNIPIARWLSMFWLCSAVSLVLGQFSGSVTLNGYKRCSAHRYRHSRYILHPRAVLSVLPVQPRVR